MALRSIALAALCAALSSAAAADCTCRAKGVVAEQGEVVCLATPRGPVMARCDKVLNNSSWTFLAASCAEIGQSRPHKHALEQLTAAAQSERR